MKTHTYINATSQYCPRCQETATHQRHEFVRLLSEQESELRAGNLLFVVIISGVFWVLGLIIGSWLLGSIV